MVGKIIVQAGIRENVRFIQSVQHHESLAAIFGLHASLTLDDDTLEACATNCPDGTGFHVHVAEHEVDETDSLKRSNERTVHRLNRFGILGEKSIAAHCVHIDESEREVLAANERGLVINRGQI